MTILRRKKVHPAEVPVDINGNVVRSLHRAHKTVNGKDTFIAALALHNHVRVGAALRITLVDTESGKTYPMFAADFLNMVKEVSMCEGEILGEWGYCKKSNYFGIYLVEELVVDR